MSQNSQSIIEIGCEGLSCGRGLHKECATSIGSDTCCCENRRIATEASKSLYEAAKRANSTERPSVGRPPKNDENLADKQSTGRKRASVLFPIDKSLPCEWANLAECGGGQYPIIGCIGGLQSVRHHGPDKDVLSNEKGNVHRICHRCHVLWHHWNDETYSFAGPFAEHNPRIATDAELETWNNPKTRPKAPHPRKGTIGYQDMQED